MFDFLRPDPKKKLEKEYAKLLEQARDLQRRGDMPAFAEKTAEAEEVARRIDAMAGA